MSDNSTDNPEFSNMLLISDNLIGLPEPNRSASTEFKVLLFNLNTPHRFKKKFFTFILNQFNMTISSHF